MWLRSSYSRFFSRAERGLRARLVLHDRPFLPRLRLFRNSSDFNASALQANRYMLVMRLQQRSEDFVERSALQNLRERKAISRKRNHGAVSHA
jgi:hypothetical protein